MAWPILDVVTAAHIPEPVVRLVRAYRVLLEQDFGDRVRSVRLFGSRARGDAGPDSDVDVAVVVAGLTDHERARAIDLALSAWREVGGQRISPAVWSDEEWEDLLRRERRIALDVAREGIPL